ncbi:ABC transporter permease [Lactococcus hodotermopsidis]|uniref:ABC transporter permease n=1 Tax=Pseudolactococcus hodotermopsidis TaxID=2709157 RepID=A0A6A0BDY7_9LACT|nr:carbohydrate ABC transporter permease [Lactococcus hodotermopsidis]GFH42694.1 ABC transporter permease [Lactococcus hodotermopsidis]
MTKKKKQVVSADEIRQFGPTANLISNIVVALFAFSCFLPFIFVVMTSITKETALAQYGYSLWPREFSLDAYRFLFHGKMTVKLFQALGVTVIVTVVGTFMNASLNSLYAYAISRKDFPFRRFFTLFALVTMLFSPGLIAQYLVMTSMLHLKDTIWALILPGALGPFNILIMRTFFIKSIPEAIIESARIDGASELKIFLKIVLPLAVPGVATISLFSAIGYWNDWMNALLYIQNEALVPLQFLLMKILNNLDVLTQNATMSAQIGTDLASLPSEAARMGIVVVSTLPIVLTYPFFQKYFVGGLTIGGVKE